ncbi:MAG: DUF2865 domain-containing protein, partial [Pseudomonadota bacterium]
MENNLRKLQRRAGRNRSLSPAQRRRIQRKMRRLGCEFRNGRSIADQIRSPRKSTRNAQNAQQESTDRQISSRKGTVRTLCVRTCDGYYFPVSFSTRRSSLEQDEERCANMCPGTRTQLFMQPVGNTKPDQMVSTLDGSSYQSL